MKFDDATWHTEGDFPADLPPEAGATHIGMFLTWLVRNALLSDDLEGDSADELFSVRAGTMSGTEFLLTELDGRLTDEDLSETGAAFTMAYYEGAGGDVTYLADYAEMFSSEPGINSLYQVPDTTENYQQIAPILTYRFEQWNHASQPPFLS